MGHAGLPSRDGRDLSWIKMNAVTKHCARREHSTFFIHMRVVACAHVKMMHLFQFLAIFGQMCLQICFESCRELGGATHHFFRTSDSETRAESVLEPTFFGPMPFTAKAFALQE